MTATFEESGPNNIVLVVTPDDRDEAMLLAMWVRYDANTIAAHVQRHESGRIQKVHLFASAAQ